MKISVSYKSMRKGASYRKGDWYWKSAYRGKGANRKRAVVWAGKSLTTTSNAVAEVTSAVDEVSEVIKAINGITAETNFVVMNAAIKAAQAGEYGKGFSAVVDEVRKLTERTAKNSKAISVSLENIITRMHKTKRGGPRLCRKRGMNNEQ
jgi:hypothetical protein